MMCEVSLETLPNVKIPSDPNHDETINWVDKPKYFQIYKIDL